MEKLNEHIEFLEMTEDDPQLLVWLLELRRHRENNWQQRAEAAMARLAELEKQKPVGTVSIAMDWNTHRNIATVNMRPDLVLAEMKNGDELFTRPAPAVSLAELLDVSANKTADAIIHLFDGIYDDRSRAWSLANDVWDACHAAILRNIEEKG